MRFVAIVRDLIRLSPIEAAARLYAILWVLFNFNKIMRKRKIIQKMRKADDEVLFKLFSEKYLFKI